MAAQRVSGKATKKTASKRSTASKATRKTPARATTKASPKAAARPASTRRTAVKAAPAGRRKAASAAKSAGGTPRVKVKSKADEAASASTLTAAPPKPIKSPLGKRELEHFRDLLLEKRKEILGDVGTMESEAFKAGSNLSNMPIHMADVGTDNFEQEFTLGLIESERRILRDIQEALQRIESGNFGVCLGTGKPIPKVRLEAVPWAKYTIEHSRALEQGLVRRDANPRRAKAEEDDE